MAGPTRSPASRKSSTPDGSSPAPPPAARQAPTRLSREELQALPCHQAASPVLPAPAARSPRRSGARGFSASLTSAWRPGREGFLPPTFPPQHLASHHPDSVSPNWSSPSPSPGLERKGTPPLWTWRAHCSWKRLRADTAVALSGRDQRSRGRLALTEWPGEESTAPSKFTLFCGEVSFRYQLVFAHISSSFFVP